MAQCIPQLLWVLLVIICSTTCTLPLYSKASQTVFLCTNTGSLHALDARTGKARWSHAIGNVYVEAAPIVSDGLVIVGASSDAGVYAFDANTGLPKWKQTLSNGPVLSTTTFDKTLFVLASNKAFWELTGTNFTTLYALDVQTGNLKWSFRSKDRSARAALSNPTENCPLIVNGTAYFGGSDGLFYAIDTEHGTVKWKHTIGASFYASPVCLDHVIYIGDANGTIWAFEESTGAVNWTVHDAHTIHSGMATDNKLLFVPYDGPASLGAYSPANGTKRWLFTPGYFIASAPTVVSGILYVSSENGTLYALDTDTGKQSWKTHLPASPITIPTVVDNVVYVGGGKNMYALDAGTGKQRWLFSAGGTIVKSACVLMQNGDRYRGLGAIRP